MVVRLHHVEVLCQSLQHSLKQFCGKFGFRVLAHSSSPDRIALNRDCINFVLSEGARDTVFNVALEVKDVKKSVDNVERNSGKIVRGPETLEDAKGYVESAVVQSPIGNVVHTLLNTSCYKGLFYPGFVGRDKVALAGTSSYVTSMNSERRGTVISDRILTHFDHITFACPLGTSQSIMKWYEKCFGFTRFKMSDEESQDGFFIRSCIQGDSIGMKLTAMQYWLCAESELAINTEEKGGGVKFVFAEPLPGQGPNQVETFMREHGGPGIQHIGLHSPNITDTVTVLKENGVMFIDPPAAYYSQEEKLLEIKKVGECVRSLQSHGILLDAESFNSKESATYQGVAEKCQDTKYLMQVFTQPLFDRETFFLEVIQRCGATGFGAGNITALWKAVDSYLSDPSHKTNL